MDADWPVVLCLYDYEATSEYVEMKEVKMKKNDHHLVIFRAEPVQMLRVRTLLSSCRLKWYPGARNMWADLEPTLEDTV